jgi:hypothetical protein
MAVRALYTLRIGVQPYAWKDRPDGAPISPPGTAVKDPGPRAARTLAVARDPSFLRPVVRGLPQGSTWCATEGDLAYRINQASAWQANVTSLPDTPQLMVERELAGKLTLQRGAAFGWDAFPDGIGLPGGGDISEAMRAIGEYLETRWPPLGPQWSTVPRGTNSGGPSYGTSDVDKLLHALMAASVTDGESAQHAYAKAATLFGAVPQLHALTFSRTGPTRKAITVYDWRGGGLAPVADVVSGVPRRRAVFGVPAFVNMALLGHANAVKYGVMRTPWTAHPNETTVLLGLEHDLRRAGRGAMTFSDDISGFDQSVRRIHQVALAEEVYSRYWPAATIDLWLAAQRMPVLGPPIALGSRGFLYTRPHGGMTTSGIITTTLDGTLINLARVVTSVAAALSLTPRDAFGALQKGVWGCKVWGDDTILVLPPRADLARYTERSAELGYTTAPVEGATFLMKYYDLGRRAVYPLATRVFQQTIWNEKGGRSPEIELLGLFSRTTGFEANPLAQEMWALITERAPSLERYAITTRTELRGLMGDPGFRLTLATAIRENRSLVAEWIARSERGHVEDAALLAWLGALLGGAAEDSARLALPSPDEIRLNPLLERHTAQLTAYLATPTDERPAPPGWISDLLHPQSHMDADATDNDDDR